MKYLKYSALLVALLAFNVVLWGQEPCQDLPLKPTKGEVINVPTVVTPVDGQSILNLTLTCPPDQSINLGSNTSAIVTWIDPTAVTDCPTGGISVIRTSGAPSGSSFSKGSYVIEYQATDNCGNTGVCNFTVLLGYYNPTVFFVHGLDGNKKSWLLASEWQEQKYFSQQARLEYEQTSGLESAGSDLKEVLISAAKDKMGENQNYKEERRRNFIIAHSQGGVVSQAMEKYMREKSNPNDDWSWENRYYGGLVTFGSPHQGAYIMNSLIEDKNGNLLPLKPNCDVKVADSRVGDFVHNAENTLLPAIIADKMKDKELPALFGTSILNAIEGVAKALTDPIVLKYLIGGTAVNCTTRGFANGSSDIFGAPDYQRDSDGIIIVDGNGVALNPTSRGGLNAFFQYSGPEAPVLEAPLSPLENTIPKVAFYGKIDDESTQGELFWRVGFWQKNSVNTDGSTSPDGINGNGFGQMGANMPSLKDGQEDANKHKDYYYAEAENYRLNADELWQWHFTGGDILAFYLDRQKAKLLYQQSTAFRQGALWYETANDQYKTLIGQTTYSVATDNCYCECEETDYDDQGNAGEVVDEYNEPLSDCTQSCSDFESNYVDCKKRVTVNTHEKQSDGVVLAESAANMAGATVNENSPGHSKDDFVMYGSIHMQMRNDKNLKVKLEKLYHGDYDEQFILVEK